MKKIACIAVLVMLAGSVSYADDGGAEEKNGKAKTETVFTSLSDRFVSGYGSLLFQGSRIGSSYVSLTGFRGALIVDDIAVGFSGYGLAHPAKRS